MKKIKKHYTSLSEATNDLWKRGYTRDYNLKSALHVHGGAETFTVVEFHRFEGMSSTDDNSIVFAITSDNGSKGVLVDAYGVYASSLNHKMIKKLSMAQ
jgi:hypothetical protein